MRTQSSSSAFGKANFHGSVAVLSTHKHLWHLWQCQEPTHQPALTAWLAHAWGAGKLPLYNCIPCQPVTSQAQPALITSQTTSTFFTLSFPPYLNFHPALLAPSPAICAHLCLVSSWRAITSLSQLPIPSGWFNSQSSSVSLVLFFKSNRHIPH